MNKKTKELKKENFIVILLVGILLLVIVWPVSENESSISEESVISDFNDGTIIESRTGNINDAFGNDGSWLDYTMFLEKTLEEVLSTMEGAGKVKVMVTLASGGEAIVEKDVTTAVDSATQVDAQGGSHNTSNSDKTVKTIYVQKDRESHPYIKQVVSPKVAGVLVCAQGGGSMAVNKNITEAIQALLGIDAHKIKIIKMSSQE